MVKHAILVLVHSNLGRIYEFLDIYDDNFYFFIHIDSKRKIPKDEIERLKKSNEKVVYVGSEIKVNWGGFNYLKAMLLLIEKAVSYGDFDYIHTTSESNLPIKTSQEFVDFFDKNRSKQYLEYFPIPTERWYKGGLYRFNLFCFYDLFNAKTKLGNFLINQSIKLQEFVGVDRKIQKNIPNLYGGFCWFSLTGECVRYCLNYIKENPEFLNFFKFTHCPEEAFFQTLILSSPFKNNIVNNNLNYIDWEFRNGNSPANLDISDLPKIIESECFTARKIVPGISDEIRVEILKFLKQKGDND